MACKIFKDDDTILEQMSMLLDGLLDSDDERRLHAHLAECTDCTYLWGALKEADDLLLVSARNPVQLSADFTFRVMTRIAAEPVVRPEWVGDMVAAPVLVPASVSVLPALPYFEREHEAAPIHLPDYVQEWQHRISTYVRGMAIVGFSVAGAPGPWLPLVISGTIEVGGPLAPFVSMLHTFFVSMTAWARSLTNTVAPAVILGGVAVVVLLGLVGWQFVWNYQHTATNMPSMSSADMMVLEAA